MEILATSPCRGRRPTLTTFFSIYPKVGHAFRCDLGFHTNQRLFYHKRTDESSPSLVMFYPSVIKLHRYITLGQIINDLFSLEIENYQHILFESEENRRTNIGIMWKRGKRNKRVLANQFALGHFRPLLASERFARLRSYHVSAAIECHEQILSQHHRVCQPDLTSLRISRPPIVTIPFSKPNSTLNFRPSFRDKNEIIT